MNKNDSFDETIRSLSDKEIPDENVKELMNRRDYSVQKYLSRQHEKAEADLVKPYSQTRKEELDHRRSEENLKDYKETNTLRQKYAKNIYRLTYIWLIFIGAIVLLTGIGDLHLSNETLNLKFDLVDFELSDNVLIAFITTTTINVIGIIYIVARWLFPNGIEVFKENDEKE